MQKEFIIKSGTKFKRMLQLNMRKNSGAKTPEEYVAYLKKIYNFKDEQNFDEQNENTLYGVVTA
jgi:hypothetical protein